MSRSEKKGFRRFLPLILLAAALLAAAAFVWLMPAIRTWFPAKGAQRYLNDPTYKTVAERDPDTLTSVTVSQLNGDSYTLVMADGALALKTDNAELKPIDPAVAETICKYATTVYVEDTVTEDVNEVREHLADMGLSPPQITVTAAFADGSEIIISLGFGMPETNLHYYRWSGDDAVYLCNPGVYETFEYTADMLFTVDQPTFIASLIERVSIARGEGEPVVCAFEADGEDSVQGTLQSPFPYPMDAQAAEALIGAVKNFRLGTRLTPAADESRALYGLDAPQAVVTVNQREGLYSLVDSGGALQSYPIQPSEITLKIGNADGEFFRYCEYNGECYRVSGFLVAAFLEADAMDYVSAHPADMGAGTMQSVVVQTGGGTLDIRACYTEQVLPNNELATDEYGNVLYTTEVTVNGAPATAEAFDALIGRLRQIAVSGTLDSMAEPAGAPRWQIALTTAQGKTRTLAAYPMDAYHDLLAVDGVALHYISNEALDIALGDIAALPEPSVTP